MPSVAVTLRIGEAVRAVVMRAANRLGHARLPDQFHGGAGSNHAHAFWMPEDRDRDGRIDHLTIFARSGISAEMTAVLNAAGAIWLDRRATWRLVPLGSKPRECGYLLGPARRWRAVTPYVTPKHRTDVTKGSRSRLSPEGQIRGEIEERGLPAPSSVVWREIATVAGGIKVSDFVVRTRWRSAPGDSWSGVPIIEFGEPMAGPLAFGFGAHFGLGLMSVAA